MHTRAIFQNPRLHKELAFASTGDNIILLYFLKGPSTYYVYSWRGTINQHIESRIRPLANTYPDYNPQHASVGRMASNLSFCLPTHGDLLFCLPMCGVDYNRRLSPEGRV